MSPVSKEVNMFKKVPSTDKKEEEFVIAKPTSPQNISKDAKEPIKNFLQIPESKMNEKRSAIKSDMGDTDRSKI